MNLPYELTIALRYIRSRRRGPVSLITLITIAGVAVGVTALTVVTSVWNGFETEFLEKLLGISSHAMVLRSGDVLREHEEVAEALRKEPGIEFVAPFVFSEVIAQSAKGVAGVMFKGVVPSLAKETSLAKFVDASAFDQLERRKRRPGTTPSADLHPGVLIGHELKEMLHASVGDNITLVSPYEGGSGKPRTGVFEVVGVFHTGMFEFDSRMVFVELEEAQRFFSLYKTVSGLEVWSSDPMTSRRTITQAIRNVDPNPLHYDVRDWAMMNRGLFGAVKTQKILISLVLGFIILVAAFNIISTLILLILEKGREIAVLKSLGATNRSILWVFLIDGQIVGLLGCTSGVALGLIICAVLGEYGLKLDPRVYYLENLPIVVRPLEVTLVALGAMLASTLATLFPAYKAAILRPVQGLTQVAGFRAREAPRSR
jgi:lipoprotein-releasing system permease protein